METANFFKDPNSVKIWDSYFRRVSNELRLLDRETADDMSAEIKSHLWQSFEESYQGDEVSALLNVIEKLGEPEDFLRKNVVEILIESGTRRFSIISITKGLLVNIGTGLMNIILSFLFFTGYLFVLAFGILSFVKIFYPQNVGFFTWDDGRLVVGYTSNPEFSNELLGYWIIPVMLLLSVILYVLLTRLVRLVLSGRNKKLTEG